MCREDEGKGCGEERDTFKHTPCSAWSSISHPGDHDPEIITWAAIKNWMINWLSHPGGQTLCSFNFQSPKDIWYWAPFHMFICQLQIMFVRSMLRSFAHFLSASNIRLKKYYFSMRMILKTITFNCDTMTWKWCEIILFCITILD